VNPYPGDIFTRTCMSMSAEVANRCCHHAWNEGVAYACSAIEAELQHWGDDGLPLATVLRLLRQIRGTADPCRPAGRPAAKAEPEPSES